MQFLGKIGKIIAFHIHLWSWRPHVGEILDPPLLFYRIFHWVISVNIFLISIRTYVFLLKCTIEWASSLKKVLVKKRIAETVQLRSLLSLVQLPNRGALTLEALRPNWQQQKFHYLYFKLLNAASNRIFTLGKTYISSCLDCFLLFVRYQKVEIEVLFIKLVTLSLP